MRIVFAGTPEVAVPTLLALDESAHEVVGVITREDAPLGRKRVLTPSPVAQAAQERQIPVRKANRLDSDVTAWVSDLDADLGVVVAYGGLLREELLQTPNLGWVNLHFSSLPAWRGAAPVQRALIAGEQELGLSVFRLVQELDAGAIISHDTHTVTPGTTAGEALSILAELGTPLVLNAIEALHQDPRAGRPQEGEPTYAHKLTREDGLVDPLQSAHTVLARWAGVTPEPGAYVHHEGNPLKILEMHASVRESDDALRPGHVELRDGKALLDTADGVLELLRVQPAGKQAMDAAAWLRGRGGSVTLS